MSDLVLLSRVVLTACNHGPAVTRGSSTRGQHRCAETNLARTGELLPRMPAAHRLTRNRCHPVPSGSPVAPVGPVRKAAQTLGDVAIRSHRSCGLDDSSDSPGYVLQARTIRRRNDVCTGSADRALPAAVTTESGLPGLPGRATRQLTHFHRAMGDKDVAPDPTATLATHDARACGSTRASVRPATGSD